MRCAPVVFFGPETEAESIKRLAEDKARIEAARAAAPVKPPQAAKADANDAILKRIDVLESQVANLQSRLGEPA